MALPRERVRRKFRSGALLLFDRSRNAPAASNFGDAVFYGDFGGNPPGGHDIKGIALSIGDNGQVNGYWLVANDGRVFTFGNAPFWGSTGGNNGGYPVISIVSYSSPAPGQGPQRTRGYAWVHSNGHVGKATEDEPR
jgi:hypothetical protein